MTDLNTGETIKYREATPSTKPRSALDAMGGGCCQGCGCVLLLMIASVAVLTVAGVQFDAHQHGRAFGGLGFFFAVIGAVVGLVKYLRSRPAAQVEQVLPDAGKRREAKLGDKC